MDWELLTGVGKPDVVVMPKKAYVKEHKRIIALLNEAGKEGKKQAAELAEEMKGKGKIKVLPMELPKKPKIKILPMAAPKKKEAAKDLPNIDEIKDYYMRVYGGLDQQDWRAPWVRTDMLSGAPWDSIPDEPLRKVVAFAGSEYKRTKPDYEDLEAAVGEAQELYLALGKHYGKTTIPIADGAVDTLIRYFARQDVPILNDGEGEIEREQKDDEYEVVYEKETEYDLLPNSGYSVVVDETKKWTFEGDMDDNDDEELDDASADSIDYKVKLVKKKEQMKGGALSREQLAELQDEVAEEAENGEYGQKGWALYDRIMPILLREYPEEMDLLAMKSEVDSKREGAPAAQKKSFLRGALNTLLRVIEKHMEVSGGRGQASGFVMRMMAEAKLKHQGKPYGKNDRLKSYKNPTAPLHTTSTMKDPVPFDFKKLASKSQSGTNSSEYGASPFIVRHFGQPQINEEGPRSETAEQSKARRKWSKKGKRSKATDIIEAALDAAEEPKEEPFKGNKETYEGLLEFYEKEQKRLEDTLRNTIFPKSHPLYKEKEKELSTTKARVNAYKKYLVSKGSDKDFETMNTELKKVAASFR